MRRPTAMLLMCGLVSTAAGMGLLVASRKIEGLTWLAVPIAALGLVLVGLSLRGRSAATSDSDSGPPKAEPLPGPWFPYALLGILAALLAWVAYWVKFR